MSDRWMIALALCVCIGAWKPIALPLIVLGMVLAASIILRTNLLWCLLLGLLASATSAHAWQQLDRPFPDQISGTATLVKDPKPQKGGRFETEATISGRHVMLWSSAQNSQVFRPLLAGEQIVIEGTARPLTGIAAPSWRRRHIAANITVQTAQFVSQGNVVARTSNDFRRLLERGASSLSSEQQSLFFGFVLGDDRNQSAQMTQAFQDAGLTHLLAVSGENVAFVLLVCAPFVRSFGMRGRLALGLCVLLGFGVLTRWEPSVVRAESMAAAVMIAHYLGRHISIWRTLAIGAMVSILADPFLIGSVGFLLSISACVGMAAIGPWLIKHTPGPMWLRNCIGLSVAAQVGVAPVQCVVFGNMPVVSVLANVAAEPVAGFVMIWGLTVGVFAGICGGWMAMLVMFPLRLAIDWIAGVARITADWHLGNWTWPRLLFAIAIWLILRLLLVRPTAEGDYVLQRE